jgi:hypothetical protein
MSLDELREKDDDDEDTSVSVQFAEYGLSADRMGWLSKVQHGQDTKLPWGAAVSKADDEIPGVK